MLVYESEDILDKEFSHSTEIIKTLTERPTNEELLQLYGLFKQATEGNNTTQQPSIINIKDRAKWNAWYTQRGKTKRIAQNEYSDFVQTLLEKYPHS